jgi:Fe-S cluster assembly iron-binding protein IscA
MLTLTKTAAALLSESRSQQGIPDDATLRVAPVGEGEDHGISLGFVEAPHTGDHTGMAHGMPICVDAQVADSLADVKIDVDTAGDAPQLVLVQDDA